MPSRRSLRPLLAASLALLAPLTAGACKKDPPQGASAAPATSAEATPSASGKGRAAAGRPAGGEATDDGATALQAHAPSTPKRSMHDFAPARSGFAFENYGNDLGYVNLTPVELRRMFGDEVCESIDGDVCAPTPVAKQWMKGRNKDMAGGHCEGFAALALLMERGQIAPSLFGAETAHELSIERNPRLQREIAYWFVTQYVPPFQASELKELTPNDVLAKLKASFAADASAEAYTLGVYGPGFTEGHATTPYAVVEKDGGVAWILHYDNNYPGKESRVVVDTKADTWSYRTAADPNGEEFSYEGDASTNTLTLSPTSVRTGKLTCTFCGSIDDDDDDGGAAKGKGAAAAPALREISLDGDGDLLITDESGKRLGYQGGKLLREIPGASFAASKSGGAKEDEPVYFVPEGRALKVTLDGSRLAKDSESDVEIFGHGYTLSVEGVLLSKGQKDEIDFSADGSTITYTTKESETPTLVVAIDGKGADYEFEVEVSGGSGGQSVELSIDLKHGAFGVKVKGGGKPTLHVKLSRYGDKGAVQSFEHKALAAGADRAFAFGYAAWKGDKTPLHVAVRDAKGAILAEEDEADED